MFSSAWSKVSGHVLSSFSDIFISLSFTLVKIRKGKISNIVCNLYFVNKFAFNPYDVNQYEIEKPGSFFLSQKRDHIWSIHLLFYEALEMSDNVK